MNIIICTFLLSLIVFENIVAENSASPEDTLNKGLEATESTLNEISSRWQIPQFPAFLRSVAMPHSSWMTMRVRFEQKILQGLLNKADNTFVASFLGSSVTAGHDTDFNQSFTEILGRRMDPVMSSVNIKMVSRNAALGNNPCVPYDICVTPFAGLDADVVHWEQSFNCGFEKKREDVFEHFIRESINLPNKPIVIFADSYQPNWREDKCSEKKPVVIGADEKKMLEYVSANPVEIAASMNKESIVYRAFPGLSTLVEKYRSAGIQMWFHGDYEQYKCQGPYIPDWGCCSASWHPSKEGHKLRADHTVYFWLLIFKDAINTIKEKIKEGESPEGLLEKVVKHIHAEAKYSPAEPVARTKYPDALRCFTSFQPRAEESRSLESLVLPNKDGTPGFAFKVYNTFDEQIAANKRGYKDYKYVLFGNKDSGSLSLKIDVKTVGNAFLCQPPSVIGKFPDGFKSFWDPEIKTGLYLTKDVQNAEGFEFKQEAAEKITYTQTSPTDSQSWLCVDIDKPLPVGSHVLSVVPTTDQKIMIAYLMIP